MSSPAVSLAVRSSSVRSGTNGMATGTQPNEGKKKLKADLVILLPDLFAPAGGIEPGLAKAARAALADTSVTLE